MTLDDILASLQRNATDFRQRGINCCAQQSEITALRVAEAMKEATDEPA